MRRLTIALCAFLLVACGGSSDDGVSPPPPPPPPPSPPGLLIRGTDMSGGPQNILVSRNGTSVTGATVTVNGTAMTDAGFGLYQGFITPFVTPGGTVTVVVSSGGQVATGVGVVPAEAVISAPPGVTRGSPIPVSWTATSSPDSFDVGLHYTIAAGGTGTFIRVAGSMRSANVPTTNVPADATGFYLSAFGYNIGTFTGAYATGSNMRLRTLGTDRPYAFLP